MSVLSPEMTITRTASASPTGASPARASLGTGPSMWTRYRCRGRSRTGSQVGHGARTVACSWTHRTGAPASPSDWESGSLSCPVPGGSRATSLPLTSPCLSPLTCPHIPFHSRARGKGRPCPFVTVRRQLCTRDWGDMAVNTQGLSPGHVSWLVGKRAQRGSLPCS